VSTDPSDPQVAPPADPPSDPQGRLVLVRHGETEWSRSGRHTGRTDVPLTPEGERDARALARSLGDLGPVLVLASPLQRARRTAELAGLSPELDDDLLEWDYGEYEGRTTEDIRADRPGWTLWADGVVGGETAEEVAARTARVIGRTGAAGGDTLLFAHGHVLRILTATYLELPPAAGARFALGTAEIGVLGWEHEYHTLRAWNRA
jgi:probable phosphoglycerate mutase